MFTQLKPILSTSMLVITAALIAGSDNIRLTVTPQTAKKKDDKDSEPSVLNTPLVITGTAEEIDAELGETLTRQGEAGAEWVSQSEWTGAIYTAIEDICDVDRSDAQGIVDAQAFILAQQWALGTDAITTAKLIDEASRNKTTL